jgi:hypothetical protein
VIIIVLPLNSMIIDHTLSPHWGTLMLNHIGLIKL